MTSRIDVVTQPVSDEPAAEVEKTVRIHVTQERLEGIKWGAFRRAEEDMAYMTKFLARFILGDNGRYLPLDEAVAVLDDMTLEEVKEISAKAFSLIKEVSVPKV